MILIREISAPSTRKRTTEAFSNGSMWMSEACSRAACVSSALIMRMIGASPSASPTTCAALPSWRA
ncbi:MAG: hypothetical protein GAK41_01504 [Burkholderia gladioli]|nr:MAG: hypothetical protein GAK41_01504 [Burkholderia gladioli]